MIVNPLQFPVECTSDQQCAVESLVIDKYADLRRVADDLLLSQRRNYSLTPTELVHEAFVRLLRNGSNQWANSEHFFRVGSRAMRHVLIDRARSRQRIKRGGEIRRVELAEQALSLEFSGADALSIGEAMLELESIDARQAQIVDMHCFGGLTLLEIAEAMKLSRRTIQLDWRMAAAWLRRKLA